jgi:hypothetical protein
LRTGCWEWKIIWGQIGDKTGEKIIWGQKQVKNVGDKRFLARYVIFGVLGVENHLGTNSGTKITGLEMTTYRWGQIVRHTVINDDILNNRGQNGDNLGDKIKMLEMTW